MKETEAEQRGCGQTRRVFTFQKISKGKQGRFSEITWLPCCLGRVHQGVSHTGDCFMIKAPWLQSPSETGRSPKLNHLFLGHDRRLLKNGIILLPNGSGNDPFLSGCESRTAKRSKTPPPARWPLGAGKESQRCPGLPSAWWLKIYLSKKSVCAWKKKGKHSHRSKFLFILDI